MNPTTVRRVDWAKVAPFTPAEYESAIRPLSPEALLMFDTFDVADLGRLIAYRRATRAGYFSDGATSAPQTPPADDLGTIPF